MDPLTGIKILTQAFTVGFTLQEALKVAGIDIKEINVLSGLVAIGESLRGKNDPELHALHLHIVTQAFGQAVRRLASTGSRSSFLEALRPGEGKQRQQALELRMKSVVESLRRPGDMSVSAQEWRFISSLQGNPLVTRYYRALWESFQDEPSELTAFKPGEKQQFENFFLLSYFERLGSASGQSLEHSLSSLSGHYRPRLLQQILLRDQVHWGKRHVFGNIERDQRDLGTVPFMPLDEMYVEPDAGLRGREGTHPVLAEIQRLMKEKHSIIVVTADFGMGKSLTARRLARDWSQQHLDGDNSSPESWLPVFVQCADDLKGKPLKVKEAAQRAWMRQANERLNEKLSLHDQALNPPDDQQKTVFLLDGLDEVAIDEGAMVELFDTLEDQASERHRFIVFSRPGALPSVERLRGIPVLELKPWGDAKGADWLERWSKLRGEPSPSITDIEQKGLKDLVGTPLLLFMLVQTWKKHLESARPTQAALYETFFQSIAMGKHDADGKRHQMLQEASRTLLKRLPKQKRPDGPKAEVEAMLWLMGRVAWEMTRRDQLRKFNLDPHSRPLTEEDIQDLLVQELGFRENEEKKLLELITDGLLLTLLVHPQGEEGANQLQFGHKSFREFLEHRMV